jgi:hypothetical protein
MLERLIRVMLVVAALMGLVLLWQHNRYQMVHLRDNIFLIMNTQSGETTVYAIDPETEHPSLPRVRVYRVATYPE